MSAVLKRKMLQAQQQLSLEERLMLAFPGSQWEHTHGESERPQPGPTHPGSSASNGSCAASNGAIGVIGGAKFDEAQISKWLRTLPHDTLLITGDGRGSEAKVRELAQELGLRVDIPELRKDLYGTKAMDCQVERVMATSGPVVLLGTGGRVTKAKEWLKRARWGKPVEEIA